MPPFSPVAHPPLPEHAQSTRHASCSADSPGHGQRRRRRRTPTSAAKGRAARWDQARLGSGIPAGLQRGAFCPKKLLHGPSGTCGGGGEREAAELSGKEAAGRVRLFSQPIPPPPSLVCPQPPRWLEGRKGGGGPDLERSGNHLGTGATWLARFPKAKPNRRRKSLLATIPNHSDSTSEMAGPASI